MIYKKISTYSVGECSNLCASCLYDEIPACNYWSFIEGLGHDDKGNTIVVACSKFRKSTLGSRFVFNREMRLLWSPKADAVDAGELSLDDDEVEEETDEAEETESEEDVADEEDAEEDDEEAKITAERKQAVDDFTAETTEAFENEELSVEDMRDFIKDFGEKISKKASDEEVLAKYIECASMLIDDEGNIVEEGAYMLNGVQFCCGHALEISEDETSGKCSICGEEYEFEE